MAWRHPLPFYLFSLRVERRDKDGHLSAETCRINSTFVKEPLLFLLCFRTNVSDQHGHSGGAFMAQWLSNDVTTLVSVAAEGHLEDV